MNIVKRNIPIRYTSWKVCIAVAIVFFLVAIAVDREHIVRDVLFSMWILLITRFTDWESIFNEEDLND